MQSTRTEQTTFAFSYTGELSYKTQDTPDASLRHAAARKRIRRGLASIVALSKGR